MTQECNFSMYFSMGCNFLQKFEHNGKNPPGEVADEASMSSASQSPAGICLSRFIALFSLP